ncbi:MAG: hypothetical protein F6K28_08175 [Microcoleus sp. SIO2G3]|nr:hypothetical protein [Microcoleus sp. SIO2G3]
MTSVNESTTMQQIEMVDTKPDKLDKPKAKRKYNNKAVIFNLDIDAGAKNVKARLNGEFVVFPSEFKIISDDVPLKDRGCFLLGKKNYVVGESVRRVNGELERAVDNKKLSMLEIWILGAITHFRSQLRKAVIDKKRKTEAANIKLNLRILTLSSLKRKEMEKSLKTLSTFIWDDEEFTVSVGIVEFKDEAYGAALEVYHTEKITEFGLFDIGGGTATYSRCEVVGDEIFLSQRPISGGGVKGIIDDMSIALSRNDKGFFSFEASKVEYALKLSSLDEDFNWSVPLRNEGVDINIDKEVRDALTNWSLHTPVRDLLDWISQELRSGYPVYCTGGGFASKVIAHWILARLQVNISNGKITVLPNPEKVNMTGLNWLDPSTDNH